MKAPGQSESKDVSAEDVLKDLVYQALRINVASQSERSISIRCARIQAAETAAQWNSLLIDVIASLRRLYILVDVEAVGVTNSAKIARFSWVDFFQQVFRSVRERQIPLSLKVVLVNYGAMGMYELRNDRCQDIIVSVKDRITIGTSRGRRLLHCVD
jgi:hypothetical protein